MARSLILPIIASSLILLASCGASNTSASTQPQADPTATESQARGNSSELINEAGAKKIALENANIPENDASFLRVKLDREDGRNVYDIEFLSGTTEYDYEIDASTGDIVAYDSDVEGNSLSGNTATTSASSTQISQDEAKAIALKDAGMTEADVAFMETEVERDDGITQYQISFVAGQMEYEYDVDATTGSIIGKDVEKE